MREATFLIGRRFISARIFSRADIEFAAKLSWKAISARGLVYIYHTFELYPPGYDQIRPPDTSTEKVFISRTLS